MTTQCPKCNSNNPETASFCADCGTQLGPSNDIPSITKTIETPLQQLTTGSLFANRYEILEKLGKGGMGEVYRVKDKKLDEEMALKVLRPEIAAHKGTIERFKNELKFARKITHRNVCRMYDLNEEGETPFITMEYVKGEDLKHLIKSKKKLSEKEAITLAKQVCEGLVEAHSLGVIHRDLKPQNIMVDDKGIAKVMDFGIARSVEAAGVTQTGVMIGTPDYISPEQAEGEEADHRSDIYSLGVILYEMVTGSVPFRGDTALSVALKHKAQLPQDPKKLNTDVSANLSRLILICMEKERERRYQGAEALLNDLQNIEEGHPLGTKIRPRRETFVAALIRRKLLIPALVIVLAIITVVIWQPWSKKAPTPLPSDKPSLAVVYFENNTGDEDLDHWRKSISNLLITDLTQSKYLKVLGGDKLFEILNQLNQLEAETFSAEVLKEVATRGGVNHILRGSYSRAGDIIRIDTVLQDAGTGEPIATERVEGTGEESIFSLVDDLTRRVKTSFEFTKEQITGDIDNRIEDITTSSLEALKYYLEGVRHGHMYEPRLAVQEMEKAVAIDPNFAMAYLHMSWGYTDLGNAAESEKYLKKAFELSERLPARERYLIQGEFYAGSGKTLDKAIDALNKLLDFYPEDLQGNFTLVTVYELLEQWDKAIERYEFLIENKEESVLLYADLARIYYKQGMYDKAIGVLEEYLNNFGDNPLILRALGRNYLHQGKYDLAQAEVDKAISLNLTDVNRSQIYELQGNIYVYMGDWTLAEKEYLKLLDSEELLFQSRGRWRLANLYMLQGKFKKAQAQIRQNIELANKSGDMYRKAYFHRYLSSLHLFSGSPEKALEECNKAWKIAVDNEDLENQRLALSLMGLIHLEMKSVEEAERVADELKEMIEKGINQKHRRLYYHLSGGIELERKNFDQAIDFLKKALSLLPENYGWQTPFRQSLTQAYYDSGDLEKSQEEYEGIISRPNSILRRGGIYAKSFYMLGKIHEQQGNTTRAIEHYEKFLDLWKDADPGIAEVEDARERVAGLKAEIP
jgi:serine/threonine protein kinase/Tfp pilus assembly protein PilF